MSARAVGIAATGLFCAYIAVPLLALCVHASPATLSELARSSAVRAALVLSIITTLLSLAVIVLVGTPVAYVLARENFPGKGVIDALVDLPIVVPPAVAGLALLLTFGRSGIFGPAFERAGIQLAFTTAAVVLAQIFVASPFYIRAARVGFAAIDRRLEEASETLGYGAAGTFWRITVPLALPALAGGATLSWARSLGEFGATLMFAGNLSGISQTMPLAVYLGLESGDINAAIALSLVLVAIAVAVLTVLRRVAPAAR